MKSRLKIILYIILVMVTPAIMAVSVYALIKVVEVGWLTLGIGYVASDYNGKMEKIKYISTVDSEEDIKYMISDLEEADEKMWEFSDEKMMGDEIEIRFMEEKIAGSFYEIENYGKSAKKWGYGYSSIDFYCRKEGDKIHCYIKMNLYDM